MAMGATDRGAWGSRMGFILAAAGSAVGLGNIWGFPTKVGANGGAAFVVLYLICVVFICAPILVAELAIGRRAQKDPITAFKVIRPGTPWWITGLLGVLAGVGILSFYSVIAGWTVAYIWFTLTGAAGDTQQEIGSFFGTFVGNIPMTLGLVLLVLGATAAIIIGGVRGGIERATKLLMPALIGLLVLLAARAVTLPGASEGLAYYMRPDMTRLWDVTVLNAALGQAFFSLSLGMGAMITYGSYLRKRDGIVGAAIWVVLLDTSIALLAGFIIFPAGFSLASFDPSASGPGLIFTVLPRLFATLPGGHLFGAAFFLLLTMAALTSTISLLEVPVSHLIDGQGWSRPKAVIAVTVATAMLAIPSALANGAVGFFSSLPVLGIDFLSLMNIVWSDFALPVGGLLIALFVGYAWPSDGAIEELRAEGAWVPYPHVWRALVRYVCPVAIFLIIIFTFRAMAGY
jgi:neurotransmitter:Na+ symporter, NSS family